MHNKKLKTMSLLKSQNLIIIKIIALRCAIFKLSEYLKWIEFISKTIYWKILPTH